MGRRRASDRLIFLTGDAGNLLLGALFGLAVRRTMRERALLREPDVFAALCLSTALGFALFGVGKAFLLERSSEYFVRVGYSVPFLKVVMTIEVVAGLLLLVPWAVLTATVVLTVDMFGAIVTHVRNGEPIHHTMDALALLLRLGAIAMLSVRAMAMARRPAASLHPSLARVAAGAVICLLAAVAGSHLLRGLL